MRPVDGLPWLTMNLFIKISVTFLLQRIDRIGQITRDAKNCNLAGLLQNRLSRLPNNEIMINQNNSSYILYNSSTVQIRIYALGSLMARRFEWVFSEHAPCSRLGGAWQCFGDGLTIPLQYISISTPFDFSAGERFFYSHTLHLH